MEEPQQEEKEDPLDLLTPKELQAYIDQLKRESAITRIKVSEGCEIAMQFITEKMPEDPLLLGVNPKVNPYVQKSKCNMM